MFLNVRKDAKYREAYRKTLPLKAQNGQLLYLIRKKWR